MNNVLFQSRKHICTPEQLQIFLQNAVKTEYQPQQKYYMYLLPYLQTVNETQPTDLLVSLQNNIHRICQENESKYKKFSAPEKMLEFLITGNSDNNDEPYERKFDHSCYHNVNIHNTAPNTIDVPNVLIENVECTQYEYDEEQVLHLIVNNINFYFHLNENEPTQSIPIAVYM